MAPTGFTGRSDGDRVIEDLTPESLRQLLLDAREAVVVQGPAAYPPADRPVARATRLRAESWRIEVSAPAAGPAAASESELATEAANTDAAFDLLRSWAADDGWWRDAFDWEPMAPRPSDNPPA
jgi:hypothetical protein